MSPGPAHNLELKARAADLSALLPLLRQLGAREDSVQFQTDTYFRVPTGRLKLREIEGQPAVLIGYERPNHTTARLSHYRLVEVSEPLGMKALLSTALGLRGVVEKRRHVFLWHNIRIHLDEVARLGTFLEFEAVLSPVDDEATAQQRLDFLCSVLGVKVEDRLAGSYADLLGLDC